MNQDEVLNHLCEEYRSEVNRIQDFLREIRRFLSQKQDQAMLLVKHLGRRDIGELKRLLSFLKPIFEKKTSLPNHAKQLTLQSEAVVKLVRNMAVPIKYRTLLAEMTLTHLIAQQEGFLKEYVFNLLMFRRELLKSNKQLTYSEICDSESHDALLRTMARREADALGHGSIDDFARYLKERMGTDVSLFPEWKRLRESSYRRNLLAHTRGVTNETYCSKVGFRKNGVRLSTTLHYTAKTANTVMRFIEYTDHQLRKKFRIKMRKKPNKALQRMTYSHR